MAYNIITLLLVLLAVSFMVSVLVMIGGIGYIVIGSIIAGVTMRDGEARNAFFRSHGRAMLVINRAKRFASYIWLCVAGLVVLIVFYAIVVGVLFGRI